jgi:ribosomal protein S18 acetylase RimI-like enzyme
MNTTIRPYKHSDRQVIFEISADTAFFGEPVEAFLEDRRLYIDAFARYYLDHETPYVWVAVNFDGVIGFLFGCTDTAVQSKGWRRYIISKVLVRAVTRKYTLGKNTASFAFNMLAGLLKGESASINLDDYPAHLQIDVKQGYRGEGVGRRLIEAYLGQLRNLCVIGVHLETTSHNKAACHLYEKVGFRMLDERPNRFWTKMLGYEVKNRGYGLKLG